MELTLFLAKVLGIYALVGGLSGLFYPARMQKALAEVTKSYIFPYFDGAIALILGLVVVLNHNLWNTAVEIIISLFGWAAIVEGVAMMLLPHNTIVKIANAFGSKQAAMGWSVLAIIIGAYLAYVGFLG
ncbi:MAG: hypothetical protein ACJKSS_00020 [Patescibacteria group bacterium UBA2103]